VPTTSAFRRRGDRLTIVGGWYVTGHLGFHCGDPETLQEAYLGTRTARPESFTFIGPAANALELLQFLDRQNRRVRLSGWPWCWHAGWLVCLRHVQAPFPLESFASASDTRNHVIGGVLMGFGGVTAAGCTIGQGITGFHAGAGLDPRYFFRSSLARADHEDTVPAHAESRVQRSS